MKFILCTMNNFRPLPLLNFPRSDHGNKEFHILYFMKFFCHIFSNLSESFTLTSTALLTIQCGSDHYIYIYFTGLTLLQCNINHIYVFFFWKFRGPSPNFHIHVSERFIYSKDWSTYFLQQNRQIDGGNI